MSHENLRAKKNDKVKCFVKRTIVECAKQEFTISDMKDLAKILLTEIDKVVIETEENTPINNSF